MCVKDIFEEMNRELVESIICFLKGGYNDVKKEFEEKMFEVVENFEFEWVKEFCD